MKDGESDWKFPEGNDTQPLWHSSITTVCVTYSVITSLPPFFKLLKFANDTTLIGLISNGNEAAKEIEEVDSLASWCSQNYLELNASKAVEMEADFRRSPAQTAPPPPPPPHHVWLPS